MTNSVPRIVVPESVRRGEMFIVKTIVSHPMETGLRKNEQGRIIPRKIIKKFTCTYGGVLVFGVDLHEAVSANPFFEFALVATESGKLQFVWEEDGGAMYGLAHELVVE